MKKILVISILGIVIGLSGCGDLDNEKNQPNYIEQNK